MPFFRSDLFSTKRCEKTQRILMEVEVVRTRITLACTECKNRNYNTTKDKKAHPDRIGRSLFCQKVSVSSVPEDR